MTNLRLIRVFALSAMAAACASAPNLPPVQSYDPAALAMTRYTAVLVAGDASLPVFDNAVAAMADGVLKRGGVSVTNVRRLSAAPAVIAQDGVRTASLDHVLAAIAAMRPGPGQGCLVFATSHGAAYRGLSLRASGEMLSPEALDGALARGCGNAPTAVVISGCFTGSFAQAPMTRANRVILTAARAERASFGCGAGDTYTVFDHCMLGALEVGRLWKRVYDAVLQCVSIEEHRGGLKPSEPQGWFGSAVTGLSVPGPPQAKTQ